MNDHKLYNCKSFTEKYFYTPEKVINERLKEYAESIDFFDSQYFLNIDFDKIIKYGDYDSVKYITNQANQNILVCASNLMYIIIRHNNMPKDVLYNAYKSIVSNFSLRDIFNKLESYSYYSYVQKPNPRKTKRVNKFLENLHTFFAAKENREIAEQAVTHFIQDNDLFLLHKDKSYKYFSELKCFSFLSKNDACNYLNYLFGKVLENKNSKENKDDYVDQVKPIFNIFKIIIYNKHTHHELLYSLNELEEFTSTFTRLVKPNLAFKYLIKIQNIILSAMYNAKSINTNIFNNYINLTLKYFIESNLLYENFDLLYENLKKHTQLRLPKSMLDVKYDDIEEIHALLDIFPNLSLILLKYALNAAEKDYTLLDIVLNSNTLNKIIEKETFEFKKNLYKKFLSTIAYQNDKYVMDGSSIEMLNTKLSLHTIFADKWFKGTEYINDVLNYAMKDFLFQPVPELNSTIESLFQTSGLNSVFYRIKNAKDFIFTFLKSKSPDGINKINKVAKITEKLLTHFNYKMILDIINDQVFKDQILFHSLQKKNNFMTIERRLLGYLMRQEGFTSLSDEECQEKNEVFDVPFGRVTEINALKLCVMIVIGHYNNTKNYNKVNQNSLINSEYIVDCFTNYYHSLELHPKQTLTYILNDILKDEAYHDIKEIVMRDNRKLSHSQRKWSSHSSMSSIATPRSDTSVSLESDSPRSTVGDQVNSLLEEETITVPSKMKKCSSVRNGLFQKDKLLPNINTTQQKDMSILSLLGGIGEGQEENCTSSSEEETITVPSKMKKCSSVRNGLFQKDKLLPNINTTQQKSMSILSLLDGIGEGQEESSTSPPKDENIKLVDNESIKQDTLFSKFIRPKI